MPFFLLKGLSFLPFGGLLKNPKVLIGLILVVVLAFAYFKWKSSIKQAIYNQIYTEQAEQHIENQRQEMERRQQLMDESNRAVRRAQEERNKLLREIEQARQQTRNVDPERNGEVAPVLEDALQFIRGRQGVSVPAEPTIGSQAGEVLDKGVERATEALGAAEEAVDETWKTGNAAIDAWREKMRKK